MHLSWPPLYSHGCPSASESWNTTMRLCALHNCMAFHISSVQSLSHVWLFAAPWTAACQASLSITNSQSLLILMSIDSVIPSNHFIPCHLLIADSHFVWQKPTQHCKAIIVQLKINSKNSNLSIQMIVCGSSPYETWKWISITWHGEQDPLRS